MFYGQMGGKDLLRRKWKDLSEFVTLECDGQDMTSKLKEHRVHAIVFLNIGSYGGGTHPWAAGSGGREPAIDDGLIEVVGLTTYQLPLLQAGGHGTSIAQCSKAKLVTTRTIPMQASIIIFRLLTYFGLILMMHVVDAIQRINCVFKNYYKILYTDFLINLRWTLVFRFENLASLIVFLSFKCVKIRL